MKLDWTKHINLDTFHVLTLQLKSNDRRILLTPFHMKIVPQSKFSAASTASISLSHLHLLVSTKTDLIVYNINMKCKLSVST